MEANNIRHFICKFVNRTRIMFKLFLMISCALLSACYIENKKISSAGESNQIVYSSADSIDTYIFNLIDGSKIKGVEIVYAECESGKLIEKESQILEVHNNDKIKLFVSKTDIDISYYVDNKDDKHLQFVSALNNDTQNISYTLKQDKGLISGDVLLYLDAADMKSSQSEVNEDWTKFDGSNARAVILRFTINK